MKTKQLTLLPIESSFLARHLIGVSTLTFFEGDLASLRDTISQRFLEVCLLNPWLLGRLIQKGYKSPFILEYTPSVHTSTLHQALSFNNTTLEINSTMDYQSILERTAPYLVQSPQKIQNTEALVSALIFEECKDIPHRFIMIFSLSHTLVDGYSYYAILNMLFGKEKIRALNVQRKRHLEQKMKEAVSLKSFKYFYGFSHILNASRGAFFAKKAHAKAFYIDEEKILEEKKKKYSSLAFISSNDILTSNFFTLINARIGFMAVNFRRKLKGLKEEDIGNYEGAILYDKEHYATSSLIRTSLLSGLPYSATNRKLPKLLEALFCKLGLISNWSAFSQELSIGKAKQSLHLPLLGEISASPYDICIIFRANKNHKAIVIVNKTLKKGAIEHIMPVKKSIF